MAAIRLERLSHVHLDVLSVLVEDPVVRLSTRIPKAPLPDFTERWLESYEQGRCEDELEGTLRSIQVKPGVRADMEIWSRLASDA